MSYLSVDEDGNENLSLIEPKRYYYDPTTETKGYWSVYQGTMIDLLPGDIRDLIGKTLTWEDEPYEI